MLEELKAAFEAALIDEHNIGMNDDPILVFAYQAIALMPQLLKAMSLVDLISRMTTSDEGEMNAEDDRDTVDSLIQTARGVLK